MRKLLFFFLALAPFLAACASLGGPGNPQTEWTMSDGSPDPDAPPQLAAWQPDDDSSVWATVPAVYVEHPRHDEHHEHPASGAGRSAPPSRAPALPPTVPAHRG